MLGSSVQRLCGTLSTRPTISVLVLDKLTYAGNLQSLAPVANDSRYSFVRADICDPAKVKEIFQSYRPDVVIHLAAESHVDRSIVGPAAFIQTNIVGTYVLLEAVLEYWRALSDPGRDGFRFHHVSTDEVFGSLPARGYFTETTAYDPRSPYSASKAASDHLVRCWHHTYGLASSHYELFKQLRPLPLSGKAYSIDDY